MTMILLIHEPLSTLCISSDGVPLSSCSPAADLSVKVNLLTILGPFMLILLPFHYNYDYDYIILICWLH